MSQLRPFHLAIPVQDLRETRVFYNTVLGCKEGRSSSHWLDLDFYGHQLVLHISQAKQESQSNAVDGHEVPIPHFGVVLTIKDWNELAHRLKKHHITFIIEPYTRFKGQAGEQSTMFFQPALQTIEKGLQ